MARFKQPRDIRVGVIGYGSAYNMGRWHLNDMKRAGMSPVAALDFDSTRLNVARQDFSGLETYR